MTLPPHSIAILGGGPGGYEAALVAAQLGADVTVIDSDGIGGACVLTDCVPSKTLIETSNAMTLLNRSAGLGIATGGLATVNAARLYERITDLARAQSADITARLAAEGIKVIRAQGRLAAPAWSKPATPRSRPRPSWSPPARCRGSCPARRPTASAS